MVTLVGGGSVESLERELAALDARAAALAAEIERLTLAEAEPDTAAEVLAAEGETKAARNRQRKLDVQRAELAERLAGATDSARAKRLAALLRDFSAEARGLIEKSRSAQAAMERVVAAREALAAAGFGEEYRQAPIPPNAMGALLAAPNLIDQFEAAFDPRTLAARTKQAKRSPVEMVPAGGFGPLIAKPRRPAETPTAAPGTASGRFTGIGRVAPQPLLREIAGGDELLFSVVRSGLEHPRTGRQLRAGDVIAVSPDQGSHLLRNGAVDRVLAEAPSALDAGAAVTVEIEHMEAAE